MGARQQTWNPDRVHISKLNNNANLGIKTFESPQEFCDWLVAGGEGEDDYYDIGKKEFAGLDFTGARFNASRLFDAKFTGAVLDSVRFVGADLKWADLEDAVSRHADYTGADLSNLSASGANFQHASFHRAALVDGCFDGGDFRFANLSGAQLQGASFRGADLRGADLHSASIEGADFSGALMDPGALKHAVGHALSTPVSARNLARSARSHRHGPGAP